MMNKLTVIGVIALTLAQSVLVPCAGVAGLPKGADGEAEAKGRIEISRFMAERAVVFDKKTGTPVCQTSTVQRPDLVPPGFGIASEEPSDVPQLNLPPCTGEQVQLVQQTASNATYDAQTAALQIPIAAGLCVASGMAAQLATMYMSDLNNTSLAHDLIVGNVTGTTITTGIELFSSVTSGWILTGGYSLAELAAFSGLGLVCGAAGGLGVYAVKYFFRKSNGY